MRTTAVGNDVSLSSKAGVVLRRWISLAAVSVLACGGEAATYYVSIDGSDNNPGTQSGPWRTIQKAAYVATAGDTVKVGPGNYSEIVTVQNPGAAGNCVTFDGQGVATNMQFQISTPWIKIANFRLAGLTNKFTGAIQLNLGGHHAYIDGNYVDCGYADSVRAFNWDFGSITPIDPAVAGGVVITNNIAEHVYNTPCLILFGTNCLVVSNTMRLIRDADYVHVFGVSNIIRGNSFIGFEDTTNSGNHMDCLQTFGNNGHASKFITIERNVFGGGSDIAQLCQLEQDNDPDIHDWSIRNNIFYDLMKGECGIPSVSWYNNVFFRVWTNSQGGAVIVGWSSDGRNNATNVQILNNVFLMCGSGDSQSGWYQWGSDPGGEIVTNTWLVDYNYVAGTNWTAKNAGLPRTNQRWYEEHGRNGGDGRFLNLSLLNFHLLTSSPLIDAGTNLASYFSDDLDALARPQGSNFDIGAFEYGFGPRPLPPSNLRILSQ